MTVIWNGVSKSTVVLADGTWSLAFTQAQIGTQNTESSVSASSGAYEVTSRAIAAGNSGYVVPLTAAVTNWPVIPGALGVVVVIVEGLQQMNQHHRYWVQYRQTCEQLRREKFLYMGRTGTYNLPEAKAFRLLVENVEALVSDDNASWMQGRRESEQKPRDYEPDIETPAPRAP